MNRPKLGGISTIYVNAIELGLSLYEVGELYCEVYYDMIINKMYSSAVASGKVKPMYRASQEDIDGFYGKES